MPRPATGQVLFTERRIFALRFRAGGKRRYLTLGSEAEGWTRKRAEEELQNVLADVRRGIWQPPDSSPVPVQETEPTFHEFASEWWELNEGGLAPKTREDYLWRLGHLLPAFAQYQLDQIRYETVERYIAAKRKQLSPRSINMTLTLGAAIYEGAIERYPDDLTRNPFKGRRRRVRERSPRRSYLDGAEAISALLDAAGDMDAGAQFDKRHVHRRALLATLVFGGLRIGEACSLRWRSVDLAGGWLNVEDAKTDAGVRRVKIRGALRDMLLEVKPAGANPDGYVFATKTGGRLNPSNIRNRVLGPAEQRASAELVKRGYNPLPHLTPHSLRRTFASVLYAIGETPPTVMAEMGHTSPALALRVYAQAMQRDTQESDRLRALVDGIEWAAMGSDAAEVPAEAAGSSMGGGGIEPPTSCL